MLANACVVCLFNNTLTLVGYFMSSPREREKFFVLFGSYVIFMMLSGCGRELNAYFWSAASLKYLAPDT